MTKKLTGFEVKERWVFSGEESNPYGYVVIININNVEYEVIFRNYPNGWFLTEQGIMKVGGKRVSKFSKEVEAQILEYVLDEMAEYEAKLIMERDAQMTNETTWTLEEIISTNYMGLATTKEEIEEVLEHGTRENDYYVGTDVKSWLSSFEILSLDDIIEKFSAFEDDERYDTPDSWQLHSFKEKSHDNSYNWSGHSSKDIDFRFLEDEFGNMYAYVRIHIGGDIRGNYTDGILIDLETESTDCIYNFVDNLSEHCNGGYITIDGTDYSIDGDILGEWLSVYNHTTHEGFEIATSCYCWSQEEYEKELKEIVLEAIEDKN